MPQLPEKRSVKEVNSFPPSLERVDWSKVIKLLQQQKRWDDIPERRMDPLDEVLAGTDSREPPDIGTR